MISKGTIVNIISNPPENITAYPFIRAIHIVFTRANEENIGTTERRKIWCQTRRKSAGILGVLQDFAT